MEYQFILIEEYIMDFYGSLSIYTPSEIDIYHIASEMDIWIHYHNDESQVYKNNNGLYSIFLDQRLSSQEQWQDFGHELGHVIKHVGNQHKLRRMFRELQESQANNFMYHFCVPTFMLLNYNLTNYTNVNDGVDFVSETFNVTKDFAKKRLVHFRNQWSQAKSDAEHRRYMESRYPKAAPYSEETNIIVARALEMKSKKRRDDQQCLYNI